MLYFGNPRHTESNNSIYDVDGVFLEIPVKNCIVGMLLTGPNCTKITNYFVVSDV